MPLLRNPPLDRLKYIVKTYGEKQPWVVLDTLSVIFESIGVDNAEEELEEELKRQGSDVWGDMTARMLARVRAMFGNSGKLREGVLPPTDRIDAPYQAQLRYWWFGDPEVEHYVPTADLPASTLGEKLSLILELADSPTFADGAMREPNEADGIFPWVARELSRMSKSTIHEIEDAGPSARASAEYSFYKRALTGLRRSGNLIAQWAKANRVDLMKLPLHEVIEASKSFRVKRKVEHGEVVYKFKSGWTVESLKGKRQLDCEAGFLSHCVYSYKDRVDRGESEIYSLRDPDGVPYVTMEWQPWVLEVDEVPPKDPKDWPGRFTQVFGKTNSKIGDDTFNEYVFQEGQDNSPPLAREQVPEAVELIRAMVVEFIDKVKNGDPVGILLAGAGASLRGRDLRGANFTDVDLRGADFRDADLRGVDFRYALLGGVKFMGAKFNEQTRWPKTVHPEDFRAAGMIEVT